MDLTHVYKAFVDTWPIAAAVIVFLLRTEHRITRIETKIDLICSDKIPKKTT